MNKIELTCAGPGMIDDIERLDYELFMSGAPQWDEVQCSAGVMRRYSAMFTYGRHPEKFEQAYLKGRPANRVRELNPGTLRMLCGGEVLGELTGINE